MSDRFIKAATRARDAAAAGRGNAALNVYTDAQTDPRVVLIGFATQTHSGCIAVDSDDFDGTLLYDLLGLVQQRELQPHEWVRIVGDQRQGDRRQGGLDIPGRIERRGADRRAP
jgi:hypothetical protein